MRKKRSRFFTFIFSLIPGAGHMFMGFMKTGISLMSAFVAIIFLATWLNISPLLFILPILWFYSFFDCINRRYSSEEEFLQLDDNFLFSIDKLVEVNLGIFNKRRLFTGVLVLLLGVYLLWNNMIKCLWQYIPHYVYRTLQDVTGIIPQIVLGIAIVIIGIRLIIGKKKESDDNV